MKKTLIAMCIILTMSTQTHAEETTTETCANGSGTIVTGLVSKHKYCKSNQKMNWWNAYTWCDGQDRQLFNLDDCHYSSTATGNCPEFSGSLMVWVENPIGTSGAIHIASAPTINGYGNYGRARTDWHALCK